MSLEQTTEKLAMPRLSPRFSAEKYSGQTTYNACTVPAKTVFLPKLAGTRGMCWNYV